MKDRSERIVSRRQALKLAGLAGGAVAAPI